MLSTCIQNMFVFHSIYELDLDYDIRMISIGQLIVRKNTYDLG